MWNEASRASKLGDGMNKNELRIISESLEEYLQARREYYKRFG